MSDYELPKLRAHGSCAAALRNASEADVVNPEFLRKVADYVEALETARSAAIEEAAKVVDALDPWYSHARIAAAIRELKDK